MNMSCLVIIISEWYHYQVYQEIKAFGSDEQLKWLFQLSSSFQQVKKTTSSLFNLLEQSELFEGPEEEHQEDGLERLTGSKMLDLN